MSIKTNNTYFRDGFTELSFLNHIKNLAESIYSNLQLKIIDEKKNYDIKLLFRYKNDDKVNAAAGHTKNFDFITLNVGTIGEVYSMFYTLLANPTVFPDIGEVSDINMSRAKWYFVEPSKQLLFTDVPEDFRRKELAEFLSLLAIQFIITHEIGHHLNGHIFHVKEKKNQFELMMLNNSEEMMDLLDYKTIEMDADAFAITQFIEKLLYLYENLDTGTFNLKNIVNGKEHLLTLGIFSIHCLFLLLLKSVGETEDYTKSKYLPMMIRQLLNVDAANNVVNQYLKTAKHQYDETFSDDFLAIMAKTIQYAEICYNITFNTNHNFILDVKNNSDALNHSQNVLDNWSVLKPHLERYTRLRLYDKSTI